MIPTFHDSKIEGLLAGYVGQEEIVKQHKMNRPLQYTQIGKNDIVMYSGLGTLRGPQVLFVRNSQDQSLL